MSETQKWMASISGAIVGQVIVLLFFMLLVNRPQATELTKNHNTAPAEVTIMLSELTTEPELPPEPEPEPEPEKNPLEKSFINTDSNTAVAEAPKNASFESDRNTIASTKFRPDETLPQEQGPTTVGSEEAPGFQLNDQEYQDGEIQDSSTPPPSSALVAQPVKPPEPPEPEQQPTESEQPPLEQEAETLTEAETENRSETPTPDSSEEELLQVGNGAKPNDLASIEEKVVSSREVPKEIAEPASPKQIKPPPVDSTEAKRLEQTNRELEELQRQLTLGAFSPSFRAQTRQSNRNGNISQLGEGSVNAESTAVGAYKKSVSSAIGKKWHAYRKSSGIVSPGFLRVAFAVNSKGQIRGLTVKTNEADTLLTEFSLKAIRDAQIPPMPTQVINDLGPGGLQMDYNIVIY